MGWYNSTLTLFWNPLSSTFGVLALPNHKKTVLEYYPDAYSKFVDEDRQWLIYAEEPGDEWLGKADTEWAAWVEAAKTVTADPSQ